MVGQVASLNSNGYVGRWFVLFDKILFSFDFWKVFEFCWYLRVQSGIIPTYSQGRPRAGRACRSARGWRRCRVRCREHRSQGRMCGDVVHWFNSWMIWGRLRYPEVLRVGWLCQFVGDEFRGACHDSMFYVKGHLIESQNPLRCLGIPPYEKVKSSWISLLTPHHWWFKGWRVWNVFKCLLAWLWPQFCSQTNTDFF